MTLTPVTLRLDPRRLQQLKAIASATHDTNAGVIASMIREKIAAGIISSNIPGISVEKGNGHVSVQIDDAPMTHLGREAAHALVETIRGVVSGNMPGIVNIDHDFAVLRRGTGIRIQVPFVSPENSFPADLALDFADLIEAKAA